MRHIYDRIEPEFVRLVNDEVARDKNKVKIARAESASGDWAHPVHIRTGTGLTRLQGDAAQTESSARSADSVYAWVDPVPVQMWAGMSPVPVQIWEGRAPSRGRCGQG
jgi:hypothetical protein